MTLEKERAERRAVNQATIDTSLKFGSIGLERSSFEVEDKENDL